MLIADSILDLVGNTPVMRLQKIAASDPLVRAEVVAKLEYFNPASSVKDRLALAMITDAEARGLLFPGAPQQSVIVEPTSGNTGIGLAFISAVRGYRLILTMPESMSDERKNLLRGLGAELVLTPASQGMSGAVARAEELTAEISGAVMLDQFSNKAGILAHHKTGDEIWRDCGGKVDVFVAGIGTGGTVSGVGQYLKAKNPAIQIYGVEPAESAVLSGNPPGPHIIQGIGAGFVPKVLDRSVLDGVIPIAGEDALRFARRLIHEEGILAGISSGAAACAAFDLAARPEFEGKRIIFVACDTAERYLSTALFLNNA